MKRWEIAAFTGERSRQSRSVHEFNPSREGIFNERYDRMRNTTK